MKKLTVVVFAAFLLLSTVHFSESAETIKVVIDESRVEQVDKDYYMKERGFPATTDWRCSFENYDQSWGFGTAAKALQAEASIDIKKSGKLSYSNLKNYDVLIIASFTESYSSAEVEAIKKFVENGGGLLFLADFESPNNSVSRAFDVLFHSETGAIADKKAKKFTSAKQQFYITDIVSHPVTKDVEQIAFNFGVPITNYESGKSLAKTGADSWFDKYREQGLSVQDDDEDVGPFDVLVVMENASKGRAVFFGCSPSFYNWVVDEKDQQNLTFLTNAVKWLGEPGGPYKQYKTVNEQAQQKLSNAKSQYENHQFSQAISTFEEAISIFETSNEVYPNAEANQGIEEAQGYIAKCETGKEADSIFEGAESLYNSREYEKAIEEYEKARPLYEQIEYTERVEKCTTMVEESKNWIALREEANSLFQKGENALTTAPNTFDPSGYEEAKSIFEQAKSKWQEYDDPAQVQACDEKISLCNDEIAKIEKNRMMVTLGVIVIVIVVAGIIVVIVIRKRKPKVPVAEEIAPQRELPEEVVPPTEEGADALRALRDRYASGEIGKEEYEKLKSLLEKD